MKRKHLLLGVATLATALTLSACNPPVLEVDDYQSGSQSGGEQSGSQSGAQSGTGTEDVALTQEQVDRIVADVQAVVDEGETAHSDDESSSEEVLAKRLVDPALSLREGQLVRASKTDSELAPLVIGNAVHSATVGDAFPRVLVVASEATGDDPAEVFFLTQKDAKSDYMLENWVRLTGGTPVKGLSVRDGSKVLTATNSGLKMAPGDVVSTYVNYLNSPDNEEYSVFDDTVFSARYHDELTALSEAVQVAGTVTGEASTSDAPTSGVLLNTGSGLVASSFTYTHTYTKTVEGSTLELAGTPASYLDDPVVEGSVTVTYQVNMFFLVPAEDSDQNIAVVGAERVITGVSKS